MWLLVRTAWRNLFRQRRRTALAASAMAVSLAMAIPTYGLITGIRTELLKGITGMELGHLQAHERSYPGGRALQSTLEDPQENLEAIRRAPGVAAAAARVHGYGLAATERRVRFTLVGLPPKNPRLAPTAVRFGRALSPQALWRTDESRPCEAIASRADAERFSVQVGTVLEPEGARAGRQCERVRIVGLLRASGPDAGAGSGPGSLPAALPLLVPDEDRARILGSAGGEGRALIRSASPVSVTGVEPPWERQITFMAKRVIKGRYLGPEPKGEILVGSRLATSQRLKVGDKLFLQAATLDMSTGAFYQDFRVVGIFRTGVAGVDRSRVFVHIQDARRMMGLGRSAHELVIRAKHPAQLGPLRDALAKLLARTPLRVTTELTGKRAGSAPLPAPVIVYEPAGNDARLLVPDALGPTLGRAPGAGLQGRRIYASAKVGAARPVKARVESLDPKALEARLGRAPEAAACGVYAVEPEAKALGIGAGATLYRVAAEEEPCTALRVVGLLPAAVPPSPRGRPREKPKKAATETSPAAAAAPPAAATVTLVPAPALAPKPEAGQAARPTSDDDTGLATLPEGPIALLLEGRSEALRLVGVEYVAEKSLSGLERRVVKGRYPAGNTSGGRAWPVLVTQAAATRLGGLTPGASLLVDVKDAEGQAGKQALVVAALLGPGRAGEPDLVLPYFEAQQVDARRLNARCHEIALGPASGVTPRALERAARAQLQPLLRTWDEIAPQMKEVTKMQDTFTGILLFIIFAIAGTTVMNTMLMAVFERTREFGVLKSLGLRPVQVFGLIVAETLLLAVLGTAVGGSAGIALGHYLVTTGIDMSSISDGFTAQGAFINPVWKAVLSMREVLFPMFMMSLVCLAVSLYPAFRAGRLKPVEALRHRG